MSESIPPLSPSEPFLRWLQANPALVSLPFEVLVDPLGIEGATLLAEPPVDFEIDDTAMSVGLQDQLRSLCPGQSRCRVWLRGTYGELEPVEGLEAEGPVFAPRQVLGVIEGRPGAAPPSPG